MFSSSFGWAISAVSKRLLSSLLGLLFLHRVRIDSLPDMLREGVKATPVCY